MNNHTIIPYSLKDAPSLIEKLLPVQKLSAESYKEQMAGIGKTLTAVGSYWKGRKPLILNKACVLGCLLPTTQNLQRDLEIFEKLMAMDDESFVIRLGQRPQIAKILASVSIPNIHDYFEVNPVDALPLSAPLELATYSNVKIKWRDHLPEATRRGLEAKVINKQPYRTMVEAAKRPEEVMDSVHSHIWEEVNEHLGTNAHSFPALVEQLGLMRFGHRPSSLSERSPLRTGHGVLHSDHE